MKIAGRMAIVELFVDIERGRHLTLSAALMHAIRRTADERRSDVLRILKDKSTATSDFVIFPGWTLVGDDLPEEMIKAAGNRTMVLETLPAAPTEPGGRKGQSGKGTFTKVAKGPGSSNEEVPWRTYVIHGGRKLGPFSQFIITGGDAGIGDTPSQRTRMLKSELQSEKRSWSTGSALWICGEVNALYGGGKGKKVVPWIDGLPTKWSFVANPAHSPTRLQAMRDKRAHLSGAGVLLSTANTHSSWVDSKGQRRSAGWTAAEVYQHGKPVALSSTKGKSSTVFEVGDHRVVVIE